MFSKKEGQSGIVQDIKTPNNNQNRLFWELTDEFDELTEEELQKISGGYGVQIETKCNDGRLEANLLNPDGPLVCIPLGAQQ